MWLSHLCLQSPLVLATQADMMLGGFGPLRCLVNITSFRINVSFIFSSRSEVTNRVVFGLITWFAGPGKSSREFVYIYIFSRCTFAVT